MLNTPLASVIISVCASLLIIGSFIVIMRAKRAQYKAENAQLDEIINMDDEEFEAPKNNITSRWMNHWNSLFKNMGWERYSENENAGRDVAIGVAVTIVVSYLFLSNIFLSIMFALIGVYLLNTVIRSRINQREERINKQLPGFLQNLKANVQANETPERAILKIVDKMPSPLYEDLRIVKDKLMSNSTFSEAIEALSHKTKSSDLKFLCACMIQAASTGTNMESQIDTIEKQLIERERITREMNRTVKNNMPAFWAATIVIPVGFIATTILNPQAKDFWFKEPISYVLLAIVVGLYFASIWGIKTVIDGVRNL